MDGHLPVYQDQGKYPPRAYIQYQINYLSFDIFNNHGDFQ